MVMAEMAATSTLGQQGGYPASTISEELIFTEIMENTVS